MPLLPNLLVKIAPLSFLTVLILVIMFTAGIFNTASKAPQWIMTLAATFMKGFREMLPIGKIRQTISKKEQGQA